jgi:hypothetical protein
MAASSPAAERKELAALVAELRQHHDGFEQAQAAWSREALARKKELRQARAGTLLQIEVIHARLGAVDAVFELAQLPFRRKINLIEKVLHAAPGADPHGEWGPRSGQRSTEGAWRS